MGNDFGPRGRRNGRFRERYNYHYRRVTQHDVYLMLDFNFTRKAGWLTVGFVFAITPLVMSAFGQTDQAAFDQGVASFRAGNYSRAEDLFRAAIDVDPADAQSYYMLARIYTETELEDYGKAGKSLNKAIEADPQNVDYMVAKLEHLRAESSNFITDRVRDSKRMGLAKKVLEIDPENGVAHEELGKTYVRDFWRYRNAISLPTLGLREELEYRNRGEFDPSQLPTADDAAGSNPALSRFAEPTLNEDQFWAPDQYEFRNDDLFNIDRLQLQGIPVQQLTDRADKAYARAIIHLNRALESDPMRRRVYDYLMQIYVLKEDYPRAMSSLQSMYTFFPEEPELWFYLGLVHHRTGQNDAAAKAFETGLRYSPAEVRYAFENIDLFLPPEEKDQYEQDPVAYASRYWTSKDPRYLTPFNERKLEHYSRLVYADLLYGAPRINLRGWETQRGQILVRYGPPISDVVVSGGYEAILTHLIQSRARSNNYLDNPLAGQDIRDFDQLVLEANTFAIWEYGDFRFVFEDPFRNNEYRLYSPPADLLNESLDAWANDYTIMAEETFRETPEQYEYEAPGRQVDIPYLVSTFRGSGAQTDVLVHYGIPVQSYDPDEHEVNLTVNTGTFLIDNENDVLIERRETLYGLLTSQITSFDQVSLWVDTNTLSAAPGTHEISVEFETLGGGTVAVQRREVEVPDYRRGKTTLSDLLLAYAVEATENSEPINPGDVVRHDLSISPAPWSVFNVKQQIYLYFELYDLGLNAEGRSDYEVEASLRPKDKKGGFLGFGGSDKGVSVHFDGGGNFDVDYQSLILDASDQEPGLYKLSVKVRDRNSSKTVEKDQELFLE
ncbi:MAG: tetratricopeptide repeat protein [Rhodothermia bacterium]